MYLKALELQGFKSFPDKTVLTFEHGITGVVGPNGSGKSNIADAVRWVLGEKSTKSLRGAKMEDVIFSGTASRRPQGFAEVTLRLDNSDGALSNPEKEVSVTRRYYRSGDSGYLINGKAARLKDVDELFMDTGLGRDGYSMVSQGKIDELVSPKSENRREMFEEAAGISHFRYRRAEAIRRLDQTEENLVRLRDIVEELRSRVGPLEKQSVKAQQFLLLAAERKEVQISLWLRTLENSASVIRGQTNKLDIARAQYEEACRALEELSALIESASDEIRDINLSIEDLRRKNAGIEEHAAEFDREAAVLETSMAHNAETAGRLDADIAEQDRFTAEAGTQNEEALARIAELDAQIEAHTAQLDGLTAEMASLRSSDERYSDEYNQKNDALAGIVGEISRVSIEKSAAVSGMEEIKNRLNEIDAALADKREAAKELQRRRDEEAERLEAAAGGLTSLTNMRAGAGLKLKKCEEKLAEKKDVFEQKKLDLLSAQQRLKFLEDTEKNMEGYGGSVKAVLREKSRGTLKGIRGTVFQLIKVPGDYTTAIETALGGAVQNIVTETENDAKRAINTLKQLGAGRATFLPMSAVKGRTLDEKGLDDAFGFIGIASDLVDFAPEYRDVITSLLGRTAVCEDLDVAIAIAKKYSYRFKLVTLDGQVVNAGGSMTGGSKISSAGFFSRRSEIESLTAQTEKLNREVQLAASDVKAAAEAASAARAQSDGINAEILQGSEVRTAAESAVALTDSLIRENEAAMLSLLSEQKAGRTRADALLNNAKTADIRLAALENRKTEAQAQLTALAGGHDEMLSLREALNEKISQVNLSVMACVQEKQAKAALIGDIERRKQGFQDRKAALLAEKAALEEKNASLAAQREAALGSAKALRDQASENHRRVGECIRKREECEQTQTRAREDERNKNEEKEKLSAETVRLEERKAALEREAEDTEKKLFEEYSLTRREALEIVKPAENVTAATKRASELKAQIKALGNVNVSAIEEYKEVSQRYEFLSGQVSDVEQSKKELLKMIEEFTSTMSELFLDRFHAINDHFRQTFTELFSGGSAELVLEDENDVLECPITIRAQPPGKNVKSISLLSGGEKGLTAVALLFAILKVRPAPFCIFDEVEAALDDVNVVRYAQYVRMMTGNTQFILITHRRGTMEEADSLYGVTMAEKGVSKLLELHTAELVEQLKLDE